MIDRYELLIKIWADDVSSNDGVVFQYAGRNSDGESISLLFTESIVKRALQKLVLCVSNDDIELGKYKALDGIKSVIEPLQSQILDEDYIYSGIEEDDLMVIEALDEKVFSNWVLYVLRYSLLPMAHALEEWSKRQDGEVAQ